MLYGRREMVSVGVGRECVKVAITFSSSSFLVIFDFYDAMESFRLG